MSRSWARGSTRSWRRLRAQVLDRDRWVCQLCGQPIDPTLRPPDPMCAAPHHTLGRAVTGDDPRFIVAAHLGCNQAVGDPTAHDPQPNPRTRW